ncbi:acetylesterase [Desemzia sp. RIT804]|uniref:alpha/beta hydrolase n=1 Tax=Desemzia sp. RIT 804 TaxID=2810209 RepID=UPI001950CC3A|nr:alpha/beta hydrolase-fold protein [Desemzia sp. RIT 804]MBM6614283.1 acetylesterase [Desemzia sp. RIT 804]
MAVFTGSFQSRELFRKVSFTVIIPTSTQSIYESKPKDAQENKPLKTLYLLHGWDGNHEDWLHNTRIAELAVKYHVAVIMPDGQNSFYVNHPNGDNYGNYIGEELIQETRKLFHLSHKKEDTTIGGLSMGGYGALRNGLYYPDTFGNILAFSNKLLTRSSKESLMIEHPIYQRLHAITGTSSTETMPEEMDIEQLLLNVMQKAKPELFIACGMEDNIIQENRTLHQFLVDNNYVHTYVEELGGHDWSFWNFIIEQSMERLYGKNGK